MWSRQLRRNSTWLLPCLRALSPKWLLLGQLSTNNDHRAIHKMDELTLFRHWHAHSNFDMMRSHHKRSFWFDLWLLISLATLNFQHSFLPISYCFDRIMLLWIQGSLINTTPLPISATYIVGCIILLRCVVILYLWSDLKTWEMSLAF